MVLRRGRGDAAEFNALEAVRQYTRRITSVTELAELTDTACRALCDAMRMRYAALILVTDRSDSAVEVQLVSSASGLTLQWTKNSPLYRHFGIDHALLTRAGLQRFDRLTQTEKQLFANERIDAYAPIIVENELIGIMGTGVKLLGTPFNLDDIELLATLANQTGVAIRNARLVADLRQLNDDMIRLNAGLEQAKQQTEQLDSVKTDFVTIASHELRTPLSQIIGYIDILDALNEQKILDPTEFISIIASVRKASDRMEELIAAMLEVSKIDIKAMDLRFSPISLDNVLRTAIEPLNDPIRQRKLALTARGLKQLPMIEGDQQRLVQAFRNLLVNAVKFTPDGGRIEITASWQHPDGSGQINEVHIAIADTGVGIAPEDLELIFRKFYRAYDPLSHSSGGAYKFMGAGPGLGLTIAQGIIEGHHGKLWAESPGHDEQNCPGSTFHIRLPVSQPAGDERRITFEVGAMRGVRVISHPDISTTFRHLENIDDLFLVNF